MVQVSNRRVVRQIDLSPQNLSNMPTPWFCGHRGGRMMGPEHSMELYRLCADGGFAIEAPDVRTLADGTLVGAHDTTADRTMNISGTISNISYATWANAKFLASAIPGGAGGWVDIGPPPTIESIAGAFAGGVFLVPNPVAVGQVDRIINMFLREGISSDQCIIAAGGAVSIAAAAVARGWTASADTDPTTALANGIQWITADVNTVTQATIDAAKAAGLKVMLYSCIRRNEVDSFTNVDAWYSDDPWYCSRDTWYERKTDAFICQSWIPGMIPIGTWTSPATNTRGKFYSPNQWGYDISGASINTTLHGYLAPTNTSSYTLDFTFQVDAVNGADMTRGAYVYLGVTDAWYNDQAPATNIGLGPNGYTVWLQANGNAGIYKKDYTSGVSTTLRSPAAIGSALTLGTPVTYRITVSATQITVARTDAGAGTAGTVTDSTFRGLRYIQLSQVGAGVRFSGMTVS